MLHAFAEERIGYPDVSRRSRRLEPLVHAKSLASVNVKKPVQTTRFVPQRVGNRSIYVIDSRRFHVDSIDQE